MTKDEIKVQDFFEKHLTFPKRKTKETIIIAMVGLIGSGKNAVAKIISKKIGATLIKNDDIRIELRKRKQNYNNIRIIAENLSTKALAKESNIVFDSDFISKDKRTALNKKIGKKAKIFYVRTICDIDTILKQIEKQKTQGEFFDKAHPKKSGLVVKISEMIRRLPNHYKWINKIGGEWKLKELPFVDYTFNTAKPLENQINGFIEILEK